MRYEPRFETVPFGFEDITFVASTKPWLPNKVVPIFLHAHTSGYERYTPNSEGSRVGWRSFQHYRVREGKPPSALLPCKLDFSSWEQGVYQGYIPAGLYAVYGWDSFGDPGKPTSGLPGFEVEGLDGSFVPPPTELDTFRSRALKHMLPIMQAELSLVNSLIELKDFKSLPSTLRRVRDVGVYAYGTAIRLGRKLSEASKGFRLRDLFGRMSRSGADSYLQSQFNILPLISDVCGIHSALTRLEKRINDLVTRAGRHQVKHFGFTWNEFTNVSELKQDAQWYAADYQLYPPYSYYHIRRNVLYEPSTFHYELRYNYVFSAYQVEHARLLGLLDSLGVNLNPSIIWNAIPWSFLVDWVAGVSRWLDQFKMPLMEPQINILSALWSVSRKRTITLSRFTPTQRTETTIGPELALPSCHETAYRRQVEGVGINSILLSGVNPKEFTLGAALVIARKRRHRNKQ